MTLDGLSRWRTRSTILKFPRCNSRSLFLAMVSHPALVTPVIVRACRCSVYCTGGPPPGIVSCAGTLYSWRRVAFCHYSACAALLDVVLLCMCMCMCMCKCACWSCAGAVHVQLHVLCGCSVQVYCGACACTRYIYIFFFIYFFSLHVSVAPLVFCATFLFFFFSCTF